MEEEEEEEEDAGAAVGRELLLQKEDPKVLFPGSAMVVVVAVAAAGEWKRLAPAPACVAAWASARVAEPDAGIGFIRLQIRRNMKVLICVVRNEGRL